MGIYDVSTNKLIEETAQKLKEIPEIQPPVWAQFVKTGVHKQRPPVQEDWWYTRSAAVLRKINMLGPIGVSKLRKKYGGKQDRGVATGRTKPGSGNIIRKVLQQLEAAGLAVQTTKGVHKGRVCTPKGESLLAKTAGELMGSDKPIKPKKAEKPKAKEEAPKAEKAKTEAKKEAPKAKKAEKKEAKE
jgi:small subunit ribosomal protein S19e